MQINHQWVCWEELNEIQPLNNEHSGKSTVEKRSVDGASAVAEIL